MSSQAKAPPEAAANAAPSAPWEWSISEAWAWLGRVWERLIDVPYLGLISLVLAALLALAVLGRVLGSR